MIESAGNVGFFSGGLWSGVFFAIGISALLWVVRRNIALSRRSAAEPEAQRNKATIAKARREIAEIDSRAWMDHYRRAVKFQRGQAVHPAQRQFLREMTRHQQAREDA